MCSHPTHHLLKRNWDLVNPSGLYLFEYSAGELASFFHQELVGDWMAHILCRPYPDQLLGLEDLRHPLAIKQDRIFPIEIVENVFTCHSESTQQHCGVELPAAVDPDIKNVAGIKLKIDPRPAVRDDAR